jgi:5,6-dimethylbenzimidazole synthase
MRHGGLHEFQFMQSALDLAFVHVVIPKPLHAFGRHASSSFVEGIAMSSFSDAFRRELQTLFEVRRDVRRFTSQPVDPELLDGLIETACLAPSVGLSQPWRFVLVEDETRRAAVRSSYIACNDEALGGYHAERADLYATLKLAGLAEAPCHLAVFCEPQPQQGHGLGRSTMPETTAYSTVMAVHTLWLSARAAGLGLGWVSIIDPEEIARILETPPQWTLIGYFCLGYPQQDFETPELEILGWEHRRPASSMLVRR